MGGKLIRRSIGGLMDEVDPATVVFRRLVDFRRRSWAFMGLRHRNAGNTNWVEFHLVFPRHLQSAHALATNMDSTRRDVENRVTSHLEPLEAMRSTAMITLKKFDE